MAAPGTHDQTPAGADTAPAVPKPVPMPPAIMRNAHEVIRMNLRYMEPLLDKGDVDAFKAQWAAFHRFLRVHMAMEDDAMFAVLDERFEGAATKAGFDKEHKDDTVESTAVEKALSTGEATIVKSVFQSYASQHLAHLAHEEAILMPLVQRMPAGKERTRIFAKDIVARGMATGDFDFFVHHGTATLALHGSTDNTPAVATRVWAHALQALCTPDQWKHYFPLVRDAMSSELFAAINAEVGLDGPGLLEAVA